MKILIIGGHGVLGRAVTRRLLKDGFQVRVMARNPEKAKALLPKEVEIVQGDLVSVSSIESAMRDCQAVYLSVDTVPNGAFHAETDGLKNLIQAGQKTRPRILVLSALGVSIADASNHPWWHMREKAEAQSLIKNSNLAWTIFEPTWFMESLPFFVQSRKFMRFEGLMLAPYWVSGDDYGRIISAALLKNLGIGEIIRVQGTQKLFLEDAAKRFIKAYDSSISECKLPFWILKFAGLFIAQARELKSLLTYYDKIQEPDPDSSLWEKYAKPIMTIETYSEYIRETGDFPQKG